MLAVGEQFLLIRLLPAENAELFASLVSSFFQLDYDLRYIAGRPRAVGIEYPSREISA